MKEEIYSYLHDYGFNAIDINNIEKENEEIFFTNLEEVKKNINFLEEKYLEPEDVININIIYMINAISFIYYIIIYFS